MFTFYSINQRKLFKFSVLLLDTDFLPRLYYKINDNLKPNKLSKNVGVLCCL